MQFEPLPSSFRDPSGFVFSRDGLILRKINSGFVPTFQKLVESGLYDELISNELLIAHEELEDDSNAGDGIVIRPQQIPFISYPYEWSFQQLKDAALLTLNIAKRALNRNMVLKDATAFNVQFQGAQPVFIDTLSFEPYEEGSPWIAYGQFCRHFLAPLWLIAHVDYRCILLLRDFIDGIPLDYTRKLLGPLRRFSLTEILHLRLHARLQQSKAGDKGESAKGKSISKKSQLLLLENLHAAISKLQWKPGRTEWADYYQNTNYSDEAATHKKELVEQVAAANKPRVVWDIGANDGTFSRIAAKHASHVISLDIDPVAVNANFKKCKQEKNSNVLPLLMDFTNPSPGVGWNAQERDSLFARPKADLTLALAVVHHFCISNNVSLQRLISFFESITKDMLVVEFVPKTDSQVKVLLSTREDVFPNYNLESFKQELEVAFELEYEHSIRNSDRTLLVCRKRG